MSKQTNDYVTTEERLSDQPIDYYIPKPDWEALYYKERENASITAIIFAAVGFSVGILGTLFYHNLL